MIYRLTTAANVVGKVRDHSFRIGFSPAMSSSLANRTVDCTNKINACAPSANKKLLHAMVAYVPTPNGRYSVEQDILRCNDGELGELAQRYMTSLIIPSKLHSSLVS
jgi:hypothetical protein